MATAPHPFPPVARIVVDGDATHVGECATTEPAAQPVHIDGIPIAVESAFSDTVPADKNSLDPGGQSAAVSMRDGAAGGNPYAQLALANLAPYSDVAASAYDAICIAGAQASSAPPWACQLARTSADVTQNSTLANLWIPWMQGQATEARNLIQGTPNEVAAAYVSIANPPEYGSGACTGPVSMFVNGAAPVAYDDHGRETAAMMNSYYVPNGVNPTRSVQRLAVDYGTSVYGAANAAAAGDVGLARFAAAGGRGAEEVARNASWGLTPDTLVMGQVPNSEYTPRALVTNAPPDTNTSMQLEAFVARSMPHAWGRWPVTAPEWAASQLTLSPDGKHVVVAHPLLPTASPLMPNSGGVGPVLASLVTPFAGGALSTVYGSPFEGQYRAYPTLAPRALPMGQVPIPQTSAQLTSIPSPATFTTMRAQ